MARGRGYKPSWQKELSNERINILFSMATKEFKKHPERSHRHVQLARKIAMKYNVRIEKKWKRRVCKHCYKFLVPGENCKVRLDPQKKVVTVTCEECKKVMRYPYRREKLEDSAVVDLTKFKR